MNEPYDSSNLRKYQFPVDYIVLRLIRRFLPKQIVRFLLSRAWIIKPGLETRSPHQAVEKYAAVLQEKGISFQDKRILVFGYGGNFTVAVSLLESGASEVVLLDKFAVPDDKQNRALLENYGNFLQVKDGQIAPNPSYIRLLDGDILDVEDLEPVDIVLSNSVYEHLPADKIEAITQKLVLLTNPDGVHLHNIDLRDHYFKYPFEMLSYSPEIWERWLNPSSNLNRLRYKDYQAIFEKFFEAVEYEVLERDEGNLKNSHARIRPEFLTGDSGIDSVTLIRVFAFQPMFEG